MKNLSLQMRSHAIAEARGSSFEARAVDITVVS